MNKCAYCEMYQESDNFWSIHQTMSDGNIWCVKSRTRRVDEMTKDIVNRYRAEVKSIYGNRKRHRQ